MKPQYETSAIRREPWHCKLIAVACAVALALLSVPLGVFQAPEIAKADTYAVPGDAQASGTSGACTWYITSASASDNPGQLVIYPTDGVSGMLDSMGATTTDDVPWYAYRESVQSVFVAPGVSANATFGHAFCRFVNATQIDISNLDFSSTTSVPYLFYMCESVASIPGIGSIDTGDIRDFSGMFSHCYVLPELDLSAWDLSSAEKLYDTFFNCRALHTLVLPTATAPNVEDITQTFMSCWSLTTLDVSCLANGKIKFMSGIFQQCSSLVNLTGYETLATSSTKTLNAAFNSCTNLPSLDLSQWDTQNVTSFSSLFSQCRKLATIQGLENWDTHSSTNFFRVFYENYVLDDSSLAGIANWDVSQSKTFKEAFASCRSVTSLNLSAWSNSIATNLNRTFTGCTALQRLDISGLNTSLATDMGSFFGNLPNLRVVTLGPDFSFTGDGTTSCVLPTPDPIYIPGAIGKWQAVDTAAGGTEASPAGTIYDPADVPSNTAETYVVFQATLDVDVPIKVILVLDAAGNFATPTAENNMIINHSAIGANVVSAAAAAQDDFSLLSQSALNTSETYNVFAGSITANGGTASDLSSISTTGSNWTMAAGSVTDGSNQIPLQLTGAIKNVKGHYFTEAINVFNITYTFALDL